MYKNGRYWDAIYQIKIMLSYDQISNEVRASLQSKLAKIYLKLQDYQIDNHHLSASQAEEKSPAII